MNFCNEAFTSSKVPSFGAHIRMPRPLHDLRADEGAVDGTVCSTALFPRSSMWVSVGSRMSHI